MHVAAKKAIGNKVRLIIDGGAVDIDESRNYHVPSARGFAPVCLLRSLTKPQEIRAATGGDLSEATNFVFSKQGQGFYQVPHRPSIQVVANSLLDPANTQLKSDERIITKE